MGMTANAICFLSGVMKMVQNYCDIVIMEAQLYGYTKPPDR